jgi:uncharacterized protein YbjT (DUF2867 family)
MIRNASTVLAVGAAGKFAGLVIPELVKRGVTVRGLVKHKNQFDDVRHHGAAEIVVGDLTNRSSVRAALDAVDSVFYIAPAFLPNEVHVGKAMVEVRAYFEELAAESQEVEMSRVEPSSLARRGASWWM